MEYINLLYNQNVEIIIFLIFLLLINIHLLLKISVQSNNIRVVVEIGILFRLLKIKKIIYPPKNKKHKKNNKYKIVEVLKDELKSIFNIIKRIKVMELYSNIEFGDANFYTTAYINAFINFIYANIANIVECKKLYLNIVPNFTKEKIKGEVRIHIKFRMINLFKFAPIVFRILRNKKYLKEDDLDDSHKLYTKHYGNNTGNN